MGMTMCTVEFEKCLLIGVVTSVIGVLVALFVRDWWRGKEYQRIHGGPRSYPLVGSSFEFLRNKHRLFDWTTGYLQSNPTFTNMNRKAFGGRVIVTGNPVNVEHILKTKFDNYPKGLWWEVNTAQFLGKGIFAADGEFWRVQRKIASHEFTTRSLRDHILRTVTEETSKRLIPVLSKACDLGTCLDLQDIFLRFAFDNICQIAFGTDPAILKFSLPKSDFAEAFETAASISLERFRTIPAALWKIKRFLNIGSEKALREAVVVIDEFAMQLLRSRKKELALERTLNGDDAVDAHSDLLSRFLLLAEEESNQGHIGKDWGWLDKQDSSTRKIFTDVFLRDIVISIILAGKDTTSSGLSWFFWLLSINPHVERAIEEEIVNVLNNRASENVRTHSEGNVDFKHLNGVAGDYVSVFTYEELKGMHYLHSALTEAMRLYPPVPVEMKLTKENDVWPDGLIINKGDLVSFQMYAMGRLSSVWGPDAREFKPERWLKDGEFVSESPYKYPIFQGGPRICLGKEMAMLQMKIVAASMIHNFSFSIPRDYKPMYIPSFTLRMQDGLPATVRRKMPTTFHPQDSEFINSTA